MYHGELISEKPFGHFSSAFNSSGSTSQNSSFRGRIYDNNLTWPNNTNNCRRKPSNFRNYDRQKQFHTEENRENFRRKEKQLISSGDEVNTTFSYKCPGCKKLYNYMKSNDLTGRTPRILPCAHTLCEECIIKSAKNTNTISCAKCAETSTFKKDQPFHYNHYIMGHLLCLKRTQNFQTDFSAMKLKPQNSSSTCELDVCNQPASNFCQDCSSNFCNTCYEFLHENIEQSHTGKYNKTMIPLELINCKEHNLIQELQCLDCDVICCCYCFLAQHEGHSRVFATCLSENEEAEVERMIVIAQRKLKELEIAKKQIQKQDMFVTNDFEDEIGLKFADIHAKLFSIERNIRENARRFKYTYGHRNEIGGKINESIETIRHLLCISSRRNIVTLDMKKLLTEMKEIENIPTHLITSEKNVNAINFIVDERIEELEDYFHLELNEIESCRLVDKVEKPHHSQVSFDSEHSNKSKRSTLVEKLENQEKKTIRTFSTKITSSQETVIITHMSSLDCFYVRYKSSEEEFKKLLLEIGKHVYNTRTESIESVEVNELYLAPFSNERYCRVLVIEQFENDKYLVKYIDYGNTGIVDKVQMKHISYSLASKTPFAHVCSLNSPSECLWKENADKELMKILQGYNEVRMIIKKTVDTILVVDLYLATPSDLHSVADLLIHGCDMLKDGSNFYSAEKALIFPNSDKFYKGEYYDVYIRHVMNPWKIYVQKVSNEKTLVNLRELLEHHYRNSVCDIHFPMRNTDVVVYHKSSNGNWHRARIQQVNDKERNVDALLLDWGKNFKIPLKDLRKIVGKFKKFDCLTACVKLADIGPLNCYDWSNDDERAATEFLSGYTSRAMKLLISNNKPLEALLLEECETVNINVNALMVGQHLASSTGELSKTYIWNVKSTFEEATNEDDDNGCLPIYKFTEDDESDYSDDNDTRWQVEIVRFDNPKSIYISFLSKKKMAEKLYEELQIHYRQEHPNNELAWNVNDKTVVYHPEERIFFRGIIEKIENEKHSVYLYDEGDSIVVTKDKLRKMSDYFCKMFPNMVLQVQLACIKPAGDANKWSIMSIEWFQKLFKYHKNIFLKIIQENEIEPPIPVTMWYSRIIEGGALKPSYYRYVSIDKKAVKVGLALFTKLERIEAVESEKYEHFDVEKTEVIVVEEQKPETIPTLEENSGEIVGKVVEWPLSVNITEKEFNATITCAEIGGYLFVRNEKHLEDYEFMESEMKKYFDANSEWEPFNLHEGQTVTIRYEDKWYRGIVLQVITKEIAKVFMIDFGSDHEVDINTLYQTIMYADVPPLVSKIQLYDVHAKTSWKEDYADTLLAISPGEGKIIIRSALRTEIPLADVYYMDGKCLNDELVKLCPNLYRKYSKKQVRELKFSQLPELKPGEKIKLDITSMYDYKTVSIFVAQSDRTYEEFEELMKTITTKEPLLKPLSEIQIGLPCICKYSDDEIWYRAKVIRIDEGSITVMYVDYGNFEDVKVENLKSIENEWLDYPATFHLATIDYSLYINDKDEKLLVDHTEKLQGKTKLVEIVKRQPLSICIYNEDGSLYYDSCSKNDAETVL